MSPLRDALKIDAAAVSTRIEAYIVSYLRDVRKKGAVLGLSGGVDSSVVAALCVGAVGKSRVLGLFMPEADSSPDSLRLGQQLADSLGIATELEEISGILRASGCYARRDAAIRSVLPDYNEDYKCKIVLPKALDGAAYQLFSIVVRSPEGVETKRRLPLHSYLAIVAATNFKQRTRKMMEYYYADRCNYAVAGTPNLLEFDQGFFVKNGDGAADFEPIAHLYKSQVYALAEYLNVPEEIRRRPPTSDTYSLTQSQEEFYFTLPYETLDLSMYALDHKISAPEAAGPLGLTEHEVARVYEMIHAKRKVARYLRLAPTRLEADSTPRTSLCLEIRR